MKSLPNTCVFKSLLLFVLVIVAFIIFYSYTWNAASAQNNKYFRQNVDKFANSGVNKLVELNGPFPTDIVESSILSDYNRLIDTGFKTRLENSGTIAAKYYDQNNAIIIGKLNDMDVNINTMLKEVNNSLYKQLGKNYARSQEINAIRQDWNQDIDELPYKIIA